MQAHDIANDNVERLIGTSYKPELPDPAFVKSLTAQLQAVALARAPMPAPDAERLRKIRRRLGWAMAIGACAAAVVLIVRAASGPDHSGDRPQDADTAQNGSNGVPVANNASVGLTPRPRAASWEAPKIEVGADLQTKAGQRRRVTLADGSVLYLNSDTQVKYVAPRQLKLVKGEMYVEVSPRPSPQPLSPEYRGEGPKNSPLSPPRGEGSGVRGGATFTVNTPDRDVLALGTHFSVWADAVKSGVAVTQGKVQVSGLASVIHAGQQLSPGARIPEPAPRASEQLDWTRELMIAAESPLVPRSEHAGGSLVVVDPNGQESRLTMRKYHVDVHIEDGFARTTIDQTYFNETWSRLEGTFYFPLPPDATLSRLAMYVKDGNVCKLMEGGMAERDHARNVFETVLHMRRDPALLEWVDGSTFKMRVFPLEPREEKRLFLSYTQKLPSLNGAAQYRFPAGHSLSAVADWSFEARIKEGARLRCFSQSHPAMKVKVDKLDMVMSLSEKKALLKQDVVLGIVEPEAPATGESTRFSSFVFENSQYLMLRYRPKMPSLPQRERRDWVFLYEASGNRDPLVARAQVDVIRGLLTNAEHDDTFTIVAANTRVHFFDTNARPATPENVQQAVRFLEGTQLIGALDLGQALAAAGPSLANAKNPYLVHVGAGVATIGVRDSAALLKTIPAIVQYVGIGVGKQWNRAFMKAAAERTGGYFTQINPDEPINWRTFDLLATLNVPRLLEVSLSASEVRSAKSEVGDIRFLTDATTIAQGEEICAVARVDFAKKESLPEALTVKGKLGGLNFAKEIKIEHLVHGAGYLPRQWAKLELDRLMAEDMEKNKTAIIELSKQSYVMTPYTSLLVLETDADYAKYNVDRGRKDHWAMYASPEKIPVVFEANNGAPKSAPEQCDPRPVLATILVRTEPEVVKVGNAQPTARAVAVKADTVVAFATQASRPANIANLGSAAVPWVQVLDWLKDVSGLPIISPYQPTGSFKLSPALASGAARDFTVGQVIDLLNEALLPQKFMLIQRQASIMVWPADEPLPLEVVRPVTVEELLSGDLGSTNYVRLTYQAAAGQDAERLASSVKKMMSPFGQVIPVEEANQVIMLESVANLRTILRTIQKTDSKSTTPARTGPPAKTISPAAMQTLQQMLQPPGESPKQSTPVFTQQDRNQMFSFYVGLFRDGPGQVGPQSKTNLGLGTNKGPRLPVTANALSDLGVVLQQQAPVSGEFVSGQFGTFGLTIDKARQPGSLARGGDGDGKSGGGILHGLQGIGGNAAKPAPGGQLGLNRLSGGASGDTRGIILSPMGNKASIRSDKDMNGPLSLRTYSVPAGNAEHSARILQEIYKANSTNRITAIGATQIMVYAPPADQLDIAQFLSLGTTAPPSSLTDVVVVTDADATKIADWLAEKYGGFSATSSGPFIKPDPATNSIILSGSVEQILDVKATIRALTGQNDLATNGRLPGLVSKDANGSFGLPPRAPLPDFGMAFNSWLSQASVMTDSIYSRASFVGDPRIFGDLLWYAPGMNTAAADIQAVLEAEMKCRPLAKSGDIDPEARKLIDKAHTVGWQKLTIDGDGRQPGFVIYFSAAGQFTYDRVLANGLREQMICDGKTLWHLYPEIGLGAKRQVTRFHRAELMALVPWLVPSALDLADSADIRLVDKNTVGLAPRGAERAVDEAGKPLPFFQINLVFAEDGRLAEQQTVLMPAKMVLACQRYGVDGTVTAIDPTTQKSLGEVKLQVTSAEPPDLQPNVKNLVVVPMPLRTPEFLKANLKGEIADYDADAAISLMAAYCASAANPPTGGLDVFNQRFAHSGDRRIGFYVLLASARATIDPVQIFSRGDKRHVLDVVADHPRSPLANYLAYHFMSLRNNSESGLGDIGGQPGGFIQRLATFRDLYTGWKTGRITSGTEESRTQQRQRTLEFLGKSPLPIYDWGLVMTVCHHGSAADAKVLTGIDTSKLWDGDPALTYAIRYEMGLSVLNSVQPGLRQEGRKLLRKLYFDTLEAGILPPLEPNFRHALLAPDDKGQSYAELIRQAANTLTKNGQRLDILSLAWQAQKLGDLIVADNLFVLAVERSAPGLERVLSQLAAVQFYRQTSQPALADLMLAPVLAEELFKESPTLWRQAAELAQQRNLPVRVLACLEQALDLEFRDLPPTVNLQSIRTEYGQLLAHYQQMANAHALLEKEAPKDFVCKVVRAADRWRSLEPDPTQVCMLAGKILQTVGANDLAWDYLTTPIGMKPNEAAPWLALANALKADGSIDLADRAYIQAYAAEPTNAQILWDRAQLLQQAGRTADAMAVYQMLADGQWQDRFQWMQTQARQRLGR